VDKLTLSAKGLLREKWEDKKWVTSDVSDKLPFYLFHECKIAEGTTLKDIFKLLQPHLDVLKVVINFWVEEFVEEGLQEGEPANEIKYLKLDWILEDNDYEGRELSGNTMPHFSGQGDDLGGGYIAYGISHLPINAISHLEVKLEGFCICNSIGSLEERIENPILYEHPCPQYTLGNILYGIFWDLSFYGPPKERDKVWSKRWTELEDMDE